MQNNTRQTRQPNIRLAVWLSIVGVVMIGILALTLSRKGTSNMAVEQPLTVSNVSQGSSFTSVKRTAGPAAPEPTHNGRRLSEWIEDLETGDYKTKSAARDALVAIGPDAVPALREALNDNRSLNSAAFALASIGKEALPVLLDALTNGPLQTRKEIAGAGVMQVHALLPYEAEIVPVLVQCMRHEDGTVRAGAVNALQSFWKQPDIVMPALMDCLTDTNAGVRGAAVTVIREFGRDAEPALSVLVRLAKEDADSYVKTRAAESLRVLAPQRADQEGL